MKDKKEILDIIIRYSLIIILAIPNLFLFYFIFTPLTVYPVYWVLGIFSDASLLGNNIILTNGIPIELIKACIAGSAYYLLLILNLSIPKIEIKKRIKILMLSFSTLLTFNIIRILVLVLIYFQGLAFFDITHKFFWYFMSTVFVVGIWFFQIRYFKIKEVPVYSDIKLLIKEIKKNNGV